ncbi:WbqC family protein [Prosthecobacter fluviatilis]|uniref:WbqC family protein n=1 Tax=Prosthecobacter fluviatilis TaxID=445931 RepID=A0ABW0KMD7_9BACT
MRLAIMQPYFLPYIGYFQLMKAADRFVFLDDVNYINRGWINRNRLRTPQGPAWFTLPLIGASQNRLICEIDIKTDDGWKRSLERTISITYSKAPFFADIFPLFQSWLSSASGNLAQYLSRNLQDIAAWLGLDTQMVPSSSIYPKGELRGQHRILDICLREGADMYVNPPGGRELYDASVFSSSGVQLQFLKPELQNLQLVSAGEDGPVLSILDLMMYNSQQSLRQAVSTFHVETACPTSSLS